MKRLVWGIVVALLVGSVTVHAQGAHKSGSGSNHVSGSVHVTFSTGDVQVIREYYAPRYRALPPGLQKKFQPFAPEVERRLVVLPAGYRRGIVDGQAVIIDDRTHLMIDVAAVF